MTSVSVSLQQLDNGDMFNGTGTGGGGGNVDAVNADQITKLFKKCRPRSDVNLNPVVIVPNSEHNTSIDMDLNDSDRSASERSKSSNDSKDRRDSEKEQKQSVQPSDLDVAKEGNDHGVDEEEDLEGGPSFSSDDGEGEGEDEDSVKDNQVIILTSNKGGTYKLRDSRIIEIAGGREIYSQSRTKAARKSRYIGENTDKKKGIWDLRSRCSNDSKKHKNASREITETVFSTEICSVRHQRPVTSSGFASKPNLAYVSSNSDVDGLINPSRNMAVVSGGEVVVFDDIGDEWQGLRLDLCPNNKTDRSQSETDRDNNSSRGESPTPSPYHRTATDFFKVMASVSDFDGDSLSPEPNNKVTQVIGNLPIAVYEGSPRRYGPRQNESNQTNHHPMLPSAHSLLASPSVYPPRPGFPQRIITTPGESESQNNVTTSETDISPPMASTFDYLYEFSETRKVLEEFFKCPPDDENPLGESEFQDLDYELHRQAGGTDSGSSYVGQRLAKGRPDQNDFTTHMESPRKPQNITDFPRIQEHEIVEHENNFLDLSVGTGSSGDLGETEVGLQVGHSRNFTLSPETTDCDSNCGDLDSEMSLMLIDNELGPSSVGLLGSSGDLAAPTDSLRLYSSMPVLEDGLSSGHASDTDNNNPTVLLMKRQITEIERELIQRSHNENVVTVSTMTNSSTENECPNKQQKQENNGFLINTPPVEVVVCSEAVENSFEDNIPEITNADPLSLEMTPPPPAPAPHRRPSGGDSQTSPGRVEAAIQDIRLALQRTKTLPHSSAPTPTSPGEQPTASPVWVPRQCGLSNTSSNRDTESARKTLSGEEVGEEEEADTDLETDRLLGQQRTDDQGFYDDKLEWRKPKTRTIMPSNSSNKSSTPKQMLALSPTQSGIENGGGAGGGASPALAQPAPNTPPPSVTQAPIALSATNGSPDKNLSPQSQKGSTTSVKSKKDKENKKKGRNKEGLRDPSVLIEGVLFRARYLGSTQLACEGQPTKSTRMMQAEEAVSRIKEASNQISQSYRSHYGHSSLTSLGSYDDETGIEDDDEDDENPEIVVPVCNDNDSSLAADSATTNNGAAGASTGNNCQRNYPVTLPLPLPLGVGATGTVFRLQFLGSVEVEEEGGRKRRKRLKKNMVEEAVTKIKAPDGESQPSTEVDLFISTEKIMVLNTDLKEIMMDHALRTISYIADIGDLVVLMARRRLVPHEMEDPPKINRTPKMICHVFESEEAQFIAQSIGQAFQVAYMEFLKANGIEDHSFVKEMDYQEVLNSQEIFGDELQMFAKKEMQKEVVVPKAKGEILGVVIVESGWGSMLPTVVIANLAPAGAAARCGQLNIGDQIIAINGVSLVGLPLSTCQNYIKNSKNQTVVKLTVVPCAPVVEVKIKRPDTKYQLGFSVQNGVICSLLRGGIAERGGVRVGHRIIEINNQSVVAVPHEKIVNLLATSVGEILMKTMPTSMFRLLTGQENPVYI